MSRKSDVFHDEWVGLLNWWMQYQTGATQIWKFRNLQAFWNNVKGASESAHIETEQKTHTHTYCLAAETLNHPAQPIKATASEFPAKRSASGGKVLLDGQFDTSIKRQLWPQCACDVFCIELKGGKTAAVSLCSGCLKIVGFSFRAKTCRILWNNLTSKRQVLMYL